MMRWLRRRRERDFPPLFDSPNADQPIELDEEEREIASRTTSGPLGQAVQTVDEKGRRFAEPIKGELEDFVLVEALMRLLGLATSKLKAGDFRGAARTSIKVIGIGGTLNNPTRFAAQEAWLLLAEIHTGYGDRQRSRVFLKTVKEKVSQEIGRLRDQGDEGLARAYESEWEARLSELQTRSRKRS